MTIANTKPAFMHHPAVTMTACPATANTNRDGTGTITAIYTADTAVNGSIVQSIKAIAIAASAVSALNLFRSTDAGVTWKFVGQLGGPALRTAITPSATVLADECYYTGLDMPMLLNASDKLGFAPTTANAYNVFVQGGPLVNSDA
jgi:hypothetical protein